MKEKEKYEKVGVITDNPHLAYKINNILAPLSLVYYSFFISPFSDRDHFKVEVERKIDMRNIIDIDFLLSKFDLIISLHCKQLFPKRLIDKIKCINVHPGYNPVNRGWYPQVFAIINDSVIGATIHEIDEKLDHGKIIDRMIVRKEIDDTSESLYGRIQEAEIALFEKNINAIIENRYSLIIPENEGKLFLKKDFDSLKLIDLNKKATYGMVINHLRAMTHGNFKNTYFLDENGEKIYARIILEKG